MFSAPAKSRLLLALVILPLIAAGFLAIESWNQPNSLPGVTGMPGLFGSSEAIGGMKESLAQERNQLATLEQDQSRLRLQVIRHRKLYRDGAVSIEQVHESERLFVAALNRVHETRRAVMEADIAVTEALLGEKVERLPALPVNGYSETTDLARFNGGFKWSLKEAPRIEKYFSQSFGRRLPVTALGQSATHTRLRFDHRDAMDVALHPDSPEGKALIAHLRQAGIPFIAFRSAIPGASTGPHIHIGRPSGRLTS